MDVNTPFCHTTETKTKMIFNFYEPKFWAVKRKAEKTICVLSWFSLFFGKFMRWYVFLIIYSFLFSNCVVFDFHFNINASQGSVLCRLHIFLGDKIDHCHGIVDNNKKWLSQSEPAAAADIEMFDILSGSNFERIPKIQSIFFFFGGTFVSTLFDRIDPLWFTCERPKTRNGYYCIIFVEIESGGNGMWRFVSNYVSYTFKMGEHLDWDRWWAAIIRTDVCTQQRRQSTIYGSLVYLLAHCVPWEWKAFNALLMDAVESAVCGSLFCRFVGFIFIKILSIQCDHESLVDTRREKRCAQLTQ